MRDARPTHEALSLATLAAIAVHGLAFALDGFVGVGVVGAVVPFASSFSRVPVALGQIAGYGLATLGLTYYARARIGVARWRRVHRTAGLFWLLAVAHVLLTGTDVRTSWFLVATLSPVAAALTALTLRRHERHAAKAA